MLTAEELARNYESGRYGNDVALRLATYFTMNTRPNLATAVALESGDVSNVSGATMTMLTGRATGRELTCVAAAGDAILATSIDPRLFTDVEPGDGVRISNRNHLAYCYYHRHQIDVDLPEWRDFQLDGEPIYPQRPRYDFPLRGPRNAGRFSGKLVLLHNAHDRGPWPVGAVHYHRLVRARLGDRTEQQFRLWWFDPAPELAPSLLPPGTRAVPATGPRNFMGATRQAVYDLVDWVEHGIEPPPSSEYEWTSDCRLVLGRSASAGGVQPIVSVTANGATRADVGVGQPVRLCATAEVPARTGRVVAVEWDVDGTGRWQIRHDEIDGSSAEVEVTTTCSYPTPGTFFPAMRVSTHRDGDVTATDCHVTTVRRVRVVVR